MGTCLACIAAVDSRDSVSRFALSTGIGSGPRSKSGDPVPELKVPWGVSGASLRGLTCL